jgi:uncharacterized membrane protein YgdD (TMEM256/DUF423 family)
MRGQSAAFAAAVPAPAASPRSWLLAILFASIFLQRFAIPLSQTGIGFNFCVTLAGLAVLGWRGALVVDPARAVAACGFVAAVWLSSLLNPLTTSAGSIALVLAIYLPFAVSLRTPGTAFEDCLAAFQTMILVCAVCGIAQFIAQFVVSPQYLFTFRGLLPDPILLGGISDMLPLAWGANLYRSNGFFFVEPSTCSQYMALAIVFELLFRGTTWRLPVYVVSLALTYSGTGIILLILMLPCVLVHRRAFGAIGVIGLLALVAVAFSDVLNMDTLVMRSGEFGQEGSSATARYIAPAWMVGDRLFTRLPDLLFGIGPGTFLAQAVTMAHETHDPVWAKVVFEYGLVGALAFVPLFVLAVFARAPSRWVSAALTIGYLTFGGMMLDPRLHALLLVFCVLPKRPAEAGPGLRSHLRPQLRPGAHPAGAGVRA